MEKKIEITYGQGMAGWNTPRANLCAGIQEANGCRYLNVGIYDNRAPEVQLTALLVLDDPEANVSALLRELADTMESDEARGLIPVWADKPAADRFWPVQ